MCQLVLWWNSIEVYSIHYIYYFSLQQRDIAPETMPDYVNNNDMSGTVLRSSRRQEGKYENETKTNKRSSRTPSREGAGLLFAGGTVSQ